MHYSSSLLLLGAVLSFFATDAFSAEALTINLTDRAPMFDGRCDDEEWRAATRIKLPAEVSVYLMHDRDALYVCARGKAQDYTVIDLYIEDTATGYLHNLHASAQLFERVLSDRTWSEPAWWQQKDWTGFWVPFAGSEETENGARPTFLKGSHREIQVLRKKFSGNTWTMMIGVSAVEHEGSLDTELTYPENAVDTDRSTWRKFVFSEP